MTNYAEDAEQTSIEDWTQQSYIPGARTRRVQGVKVAAQVPQSRSLMLRRICTTVISAALLASCQASSQSNSPDVTARDSKAGTQSAWLSYHGDLTGRRYSELKEITRENVGQLQLKWVFNSRKMWALGAPPVVVAGVMYLSVSNDLFAMDGLTGAVLWHHTRQDAAGAQNDESAHINRGIAVLSNRLYMETDDGHLLSLDARSGNVLWEVPFDTDNVSYGGVSAPLAIPGKVIVGASGGRGVQAGFVAAFDAANGKELWRYTLRHNPVRNDSDSLTRSSRTPDESWMPGTYDPELNVIFEESAAQACGTDVSVQTEDVQHGGCLLALDAQIGKLKWQFPLPAEEKRSPAISAVPMLVDIPLGEAGSKQVSDRKLIVAVQENGFLTILDRATGTLVLQRNLGTNSSFPGDSHWRRVSAAARPTKQDDARSRCGAESESPSWNPPAYNELTNRFYFVEFENCRDNAVPVEAAHSAKGVISRLQPIGRSSLLLYDPSDDTWAWQDTSPSTDHAPSGLTTTASGLLLSGGRARSFEVADAVTGKVLWSFPLGQSPTGPPISYSIAGKQYFAIAAGKDLFVFGLPCVTPCQQE